MIRDDALVAWVERSETHECGVAAAIHALR